MKFHFYTLLAAAGSLVLAGSVLAGDVHREHKMMIKLDTGDADVIEADVSDLAVGESRSWTTDSGRMVDLLRSEDGIELYLDGELVSAGFGGEHGLHEIHEDIEVECFSDEEGECDHEAIFISADGDVTALDGDHVTMVRKEVKIICNDDGECEENVWVSDDSELHEDTLHGEDGTKHKVIRIKKGH